MIAQALTQTQPMPQQAPDLWMLNYSTNAEFKEMVDRNLTIPDEIIKMFDNRSQQWDIYDLRRKADEHNIPWRNEKCQKTEM